MKELIENYERITQDIFNEALAFLEKKEARDKTQDFGKQLLKSLYF